MFASSFDLHSHIAALPVEKDDYTPLSLQADQVLFETSLDLAKPERHQEVLRCAAQKAEELVQEACGHRLEVSTGLRTALPGSSVAVNKEIEILVYVNNKPNCPPPIQYTCCSLIIDFLEREGYSGNIISKSLGDLAPHLVLDLCSVDVKITFLGLNRRKLEHARSLHDIFVAATPVANVLINALHARGFPSSVVSPEYLTHMVALFFRDRLYSCRDIQISVGLMKYFVDYLINNSGHPGDPIVLHRQHDDDVIFLAARCAEFGCGLLHNLWGDVLVVLREWKRGLGDPLKVTTTVDGMTQLSYQVRMARDALNSVTDDNLKNPLVVRAPATERTSANKRGREDTESGLPEGRANLKIQKLSLNGDKVSGGKLPILKHPSAPRAFLDSRLPLMSFRDLTPATTSIFAFLNPLRPFRALTGLLGDYCHDGHVASHLAMDKTLGEVQGETGEAGDIEVEAQSEAGVEIIDVQGNEEAVDDENQDQVVDSINDALRDLSPAEVLQRKKAKLIAEEGPMSEVMLLYRLSYRRSQGL